MEHADSRVDRSSATRSLELRVSDDPFWMSPMRALVADVAARSEFGPDRLAELTLVVDEACALVMRLLDPGSALLCRLRLTADGIEVTVGGPGARSFEPGLLNAAFGWHVITALTDTAEPMAPDDVSFGIRLTMSRSPASAV